jgi:hypothetical protein
MDTEKIHLHRPGELAKSEMTMDINPDGSLKTPLGEIGKPPKAGLRSCAGTIEGRYVSRGTGGGPAIEFRSGKALVRTLDGKEHSLPCWMGDGKIYLYKPGRLTGDDMTIDVISSAVLRTPFGEILKQ